MEQQRAIFLGEVHRVHYYVSKGWYNKNYHAFNLVGPEITKSQHRVKDIELAKVMLDSPPLNAGEYVYINEINKKVRINEVIRTTDNSYMYHVGYISEVLDDEETEKSKKEAEAQFEVYNKEFEKVKKYVEDKQKESVEKVKVKKKWYEFFK